MVNGVKVVVKVSVISLQILVISIWENGVKVNSFMEFIERIYNIIYFRSDFEY